VTLLGGKYALSGGTLVKIFAISDIHADFEENARWVYNLSRLDYKNDVLIVAGDVTDILLLFEKTVRSLRERFSDVLYIPGNLIYG
jgi:Icc-related predicted phosphoesterase